jgi:hypothetical protein
MSAVTVTKVTKIVEVYVCNGLEFTNYEDVAKYIRGFWMNQKPLLSTRTLTQSRLSTWRL